MKNVVWVGLDVHKETIWVAVLADRSEQVIETREILNTPRTLTRLAAHLKRYGQARCVYEAGPCGYEVKRHLERHGLVCEVAAPALIPRKPGDRVKTDRRDAEKLARLHRVGDLTLVQVPTPEQEALRDLVRTREDALENLLRRWHQLNKFLLRLGRRFEGCSRTQKHFQWLRAQRFDNPNQQAVLEEYLLALDQERERLSRLEARVQEQAQQPALASIVARLRALRGVDTLTAMTLVSELGDLKRFGSARELMAFVGLVPREHTSGPTVRRGSITKTGNAHVRRVLVEAAWHYRHSPAKTGKALRARREPLPPNVVEVARKAEMRLHRKFLRLTFKGKRSAVAAVAVARELAGFAWALATAPETTSPRS